MLEGAVDPGMLARAWPPSAPRETDTMRKALLIAALVAVASLPTGEAGAIDREAQQKQIAQWIGQLGAAQFATRERAQRELLKLGFDAYEALLGAEQSDDPEVAMQAGYLVRQIRADWVREGDPRSVQQIFKDYESQSDERRLGKIRQLAQLPGDQGLPWLCRLACFEKSPLLARQAALAVIGQGVPGDARQWTRRVATISASAQHSRRAPARWLMAYVQSHDDPAKALEQWSVLAEEERAILEEHPQQTSSQVMMELLRKKIDLLDRLGRSDQTAEVMHQMVLCERGESASLTELIEWLAKRKAWSAIDEAAARFAASFEIDPLLTYTLCEARVAQGNLELAEKTAQQALKLSGDSPQEHAQVAERLMDRGLVEWADRELRQVIVLGPLGSPTEIMARRYLADSLHDRQRDAEAGTVLKELLDAADKDPAVLQRLRSIRQQGDATLGLIRSTMSYYFACQAASQNDSARQREELERGFAHDRTNVDVLIALYRVTENDPGRRSEILKSIREVVDECRLQIERSPEETTTYYNQVAWLVANTEGDLDEALRFSHKAVELARTDGEPAKRIGGLLDTLAHCYFAKRDLASAVKYQCEAVELDPHTQAISRQLKVFRQALAREPAAQK
jgi:tetratricopeptide (TPR) repeat protein